MNDYTDITILALRFAERTVSFDGELALRLIKEIAASRCSKVQYESKKLYSELILDNYRKVFSADPGLEFSKLISSNFIDELEAVNAKKIYACIGPGGDGKTSALAKMASYLIFYKKAKVSVISLFDHGRGGANERGTLEEYADIICAGYHSATPESFYSCISGAKDNIILADISLKKDRSFREGVLTVHKILSRVRPFKIYKILVLPAFMKYPAMVENIRHFKYTGFDYLAFTKLDECEDMAEAMSSMAAVSTVEEKPVILGSDGSDIPGHSIISGCGPFRW